MLAQRRSGWGIIKPPLVHGIVFVWYLDLQIKMQWNLICNNDIPKAIRYLLLHVYSQ